MILFDNPILFLFHGPLNIINIMTMTIQIRMWNKKQWITKLDYRNGLMSV